MLRRPPSTWSVEEVVLWAEAGPQVGGASLPWLGARCRELRLDGGLLLGVDKAKLRVHLNMPAGQEWAGAIQVCKGRCFLGVVEL